MIFTVDPVVVDNPYQWVPWAVTVFVALLGIVGVIVGRVIRPPVTVQDLWKENRDLRSDVDLLIEHCTRQREEQQRTTNVQDALIRWVEKIAEAWKGPGPFPMPDDEDLKILDVTMPRVNIRRSRRTE